MNRFLCNDVEVETVCPNCNSTFSFSDGDLRLCNSFNNITSKLEIICPSCGTVFAVGSRNDNGSFSKATFFCSSASFESAMICIERYLSNMYPNADM